VTGRPEKYVADLMRKGYGHDNVDWQASEPTECENLVIEDEQLNPVWLEWRCDAKDVDAA
jgi:hypothetical protein